jgi:hypothetical protein
MLKTIHDVPLGWLVAGFDSILRGAGEPASKASEAAATLHGTAVNAAATFREIVDAFVTFYTGEASEDIAA